MRLGPAGGFLLNKPGQWGHVALRKLKHILERIRIRQWIGEKARINVEYVTSCRDWKAWFLGSTTTSGVPNPAAPCHFLLRVRYDQLPVQFKGGLKTDSSGIHSFVFLARRG